MKRKRFTEEQIISVLKEHEAGMKAGDGPPNRQEPGLSICRKGRDRQLGDILGSEGLPGHGVDKAAFASATGFPGEDLIAVAGEHVPDRQIGQGGPPDATCNLQVKLALLVHRPAFGIAAGQKRLANWLVAQPPDLDLPPVATLSDRGIGNRLSVVTEK